MESTTLKAFLSKMLRRIRYSPHRSLKASPVGRCASRSAVSIKYPMLSLCILPRKAPLSASKSFRNPKQFPLLSAHHSRVLVTWTFQSNLVYAMRCESSEEAATTDNFPTGDTLLTFPSPIQPAAGDIISPAPSNRCNMVVGGGNRKRNKATSVDSAQYLLQFFCSCVLRDLHQQHNYQKNTHCYV